MNQYLNQYFNDEEVERLRDIVSGKSKAVTDGPIPHNRKLAPYAETDRIRVIIAKWLLVFAAENNANQGWTSDISGASCGPVSTLAFRTGVGERQLGRLISGTQCWISFPLLDKILVGMDLVHLWYLDPPEGFSDIYSQDRVLDRCINGHLLTEENTYFHKKRNERKCRTCMRESGKRFRERNAKRKKTTGNGILE
jgi:hypothetical protein